MRYATALALGGLAVLAACANNPQVEAGGEVVPATPANSRFLPAGSALDVQLDQTVGTASSRTGDAFSATVVNPLVAQNGTVVVPEGARVYGHVTGLSKSNIPTQQSVIRLDFDSLRFNGRAYPFDASVSRVNATDETSSTSSVTKGAVTGAAAGAVLGTILDGGGLSGLIKGGLLGAAAGTAISLGMDATHSDLPAGSMMTLRVTNGVQLR